MGAEAGTGADVEMGASAKAKGGVVRELAEDMRAAGRQAGESA